MSVLAAPAPSAADVVNAAIKAHGGKELLDKYLAATVKMAGDMSILGMTAKFDAEITYLIPDKYKTQIAMSVAGQKFNVGQVMNGAKLRMTLNGQEQALDNETKDSIRNDMSEQELGRLTPLLDEKKYKIKLGDDGEVDGKKASVIVVTNPRQNDKESKLFFNKTTNMLMKLERKTKEPGTGNEVKEEIFYQDYKKVQDIQVMHKIVIHHDGKPHATMTVSDIKFSEKIDEKEFAVDN